jgi:hypothetical protein
MHFKTITLRAWIIFVINIKAILINKTGKVKHIEIYMKGN